MSLMLAVAAYLAVSVAVGLYAATRVRSSDDYAIAGRSLPLALVVATTFATWFGSETVLGIPAKFVEGGLEKTIEDPFSASMSLVLVGALFAGRLYRLGLVTIGDFYRARYGRLVEILSAVMILVSYLGWLAAQVTAFGLVFWLLSGGAIPLATGMIVGTAVVLIYTLFGGMWSLALTDCVQSVVIVAGVTLIAIYAAGLAGGAGEVLAHADARGLLRFLPQGDFHAWLFWLGAGLTFLIGSIPQQDVFQRVMAARDADAAVKGPILGGAAYLAFALLPAFIATAAFVIMPDAAAALAAQDPQRILPALVLERMPLWLQVLFFGALLSAIMSTASATLLAPTTVFVRNVLLNFTSLSDRAQLSALRATLAIFAAVVTAYCIYVEGTPIYELVADAYQFPVIGAFWPLVCGLYWRRANRAGALASMALGVGGWALLELTRLGSHFPAVLGGFLLGGVGMVAGSLAGASRPYTDSPR